MPNSSKNIVIGVTGSIAVYKSCELVRMFRKADIGVDVVMTAGAEKFVTELTFRTLSCNPVCRGLFDDPSVWNPMHISLAEKCGALLIAPCTANVIGKMANGIADDSLTALALANVKPLFIAPAMNVNMWNHPATQANLATLRSRGATVLEPGEGSLACGTTGKGRMLEPQQIFDAVMAALEWKQA